MVACARSSAPRINNRVMGTMAGALSLAAAIIALAGALASLLYLVGKMARAVRVLETYVGLPARVTRLSERTDANTAAIENLTVQVARLAELERAKHLPKLTPASWMAAPAWCGVERAEARIG